MTADYLGGQRLMTRKTASVLTLIGGGVGLIEGILILLDCPIPHFVFIGAFVAAFICFVIGFVYSLGYMRDDVRNK